MTSKKRKTKKEEKLPTFSGEGDHDKVRRLTTDSLFLSFLIVAVFVFAGLLMLGPTFRLLGASNDTMPLIIDYMLIWYPGVLFLIIPMVGNNAIRATGDTKTASIYLCPSDVRPVRSKEDDYP
jgi:Na+-driven multidrug efflux pump